MDVTIYALCEPSGEVRYVGQSVSPEQRFTAHRNARRGSPMHEWFKELRRRGVEPELRVLEVVPQDQAQFAEIKWVRRLRRKNRLINSKLNGAAVSCSMIGLQARYETADKLKRISSRLRRREDYVLAKAVQLLDEYLRDFGDMAIYEDFVLLHK